jgi:hypothetical protein
MKIVVTHTSPDLDAIASVWLIKKFLPGWESAVVKFVSAGERIDGGKWKDETQKSPIEQIEDDEVIHVDTGLGLLDHHQTVSDKICGASLTWDYVKVQNPEFKETSDKAKDRMEAISRMISVITDIDHFKEVFWKDPAADCHEFSLVSILDGLKVQKPNQDDYYVDFVSQSLEAILHQFDNKIWAEKEIAQNGQKFETRFGHGIGFETINDSVIKLSQKLGYVVVVRKDPRKGYVRIKAVPTFGETDIDLTPVYEGFQKIDSTATWFLHVSRKMLLNGSAKNPKMRPSKLSLGDIIKVLEKV